MHFQSISFSIKNKKDKKQKRALVSLIYFFFIIIFLSDLFEWEKGSRWGEVQREVEFNEVGPIIKAANLLEAGKDQ